jgi:hypothetical protein
MVLDEYTSEMLVKWQLNWEDTKLLFAVIVLLQEHFHIHLIQLHTKDFDLCIH